MSSVWNSITGQGSQDTNTPAPTADYTASNQTAAGMGQNNAQTFGAANKYNQGILNGTQQTASEIAGRNAGNQLASTELSAAGATRGGMGSGNALKNAQAGTATGMSGIAGQTAQGMAGEKAAAAGGLASSGAAQGGLALGEQGLQQQQAMTPAELQLANRSQNLQANQSNVGVGLGLGNAVGNLFGSFFKSDANAKTDIHQYADGDVSPNADFVEPGPGKSTGGRGPARATLREAPFGSGLVLKNQLTGALGEVVTRPLDPHQRHIVEDQHGAGPLDADDPRRQHSQMSDGDVMADPFDSAKGPPQTRDHMSPEQRQYISDNDRPLEAPFTGTSLEVDPGMLHAIGPSSRYGKASSLPSRHPDASGSFRDAGTKPKLSPSPQGRYMDGDIYGPDHRRPSAPYADGDLFGSQALDPFLNAPGAGLAPGGKSLNPGYGLSSGASMDTNANTAQENSMLKNQTQSGPGQATGMQYADADAGSAAGGSISGGAEKAGMSALTPRSGFEGISDMSQIQQGHPHNPDRETRGGLMASMDAPQDKVDFAREYSGRPGAFTTPPDTRPNQSSEFATQDFYGTTQPDRLKDNEQSRLFLGGAGQGPAKQSSRGWDQTNDLFPPEATPSDQSRIPKWHPPGDGSMNSYDNGWDDKEGREDQKRGLGAAKASPKTEPLTGRQIAGEAISGIGKAFGDASQELAKQKPESNWRDFVDMPAIRSDYNSKKDVSDSDFLARGQVVSGHVTSDVSKKREVVGDKSFAFADADVHDPGHINPQPPQKPHESIYDQHLGQEHPWEYDEEGEDPFGQDMGIPYYDTTNYAKSAHPQHHVYADADVKNDNNLKMGPRPGDVDSGAYSSWEESGGGGSDSIWSDDKLKLAQAHQAGRLRGIQEGTSPEGHNSTMAPYQPASGDVPPMVLSPTGYVPAESHGKAPAWQQPSNDTYSPTMPGGQEPGAAVDAFHDGDVGKRLEMNMPKVDYDRDSIYAWEDQVPDRHDRTLDVHKPNYTVSDRVDTNAPKEPWSWWSNGPAENMYKSLPQGLEGPFTGTFNYNDRPKEPTVGWTPLVDFQPPTETQEDIPVDKNSDPSEHRSHSVAARAKDHYAVTSVPGKITSDARAKVFSDADIGRHKTQVETRFPPDKMNTPPVVGFADIDRDHNPDLRSSMGGGGDLTERSISGNGDKYGHGRNNYQGGAGPEQRPTTMPDMAPRPTHLADDGATSVTGTNDMGHPPGGASPRQVQHPELGGNASGADTGTIMSDKNKKTDVKKAVDNERPKDTTNIGDKPGAETREAKRGDKESEREKHNSQHTPSRKDETKPASNPSHKTKTDAYGAKQSAGPGRAWFDEYFKKQESNIPQGRDGFRGRVGEANPMGHTTYGELPFAKQYSDGDLAARSGDQSSYLAGQPGPMSQMVGMPHPMQTPAVHTMDPSRTMFADGDLSDMARNPRAYVPGTQDYMDRQSLDKLHDVHPVASQVGDSAGRQLSRGSFIDDPPYDRSAPQRDPQTFYMTRNYPSADDDNSSVHENEMRYDVPPPSLRERADSGMREVQGVKRDVTRGLEPGAGLAAAKQDKPSAAMDSIARKQASRGR